MTFLPEIQPKKDDDRREVVDDEDDEDKDPVFDQQPVKVVCPNCGNSIITFIAYESSWVTYAVSLVLLAVLGWAALCVVPVVYPLFKDVVHHCPRCLSHLATRSRVKVQGFKHDVMSFRFGSCVVVLARKYVVLLMALLAIIGGVHFMRSSGSSSNTAADSATRGPVVQLSWENFTTDCGYKSYLGNPIHVNIAFQDKYKNRTFAWEGMVHRVEAGFSLFGFVQRGAVFVRMTPSQFPLTPNSADLLLLYNEGTGASQKVAELKRGGALAFEASMLQVGKRGAPHVMLLWELSPPSQSAQDNAAAALKAAKGRFAELKALAAGRRESMREPLASGVEEAAEVLLLEEVNAEGDGNVQGEAS